MQKPCAITNSLRNALNRAGPSLVRCRGLEEALDLQAERRFVALAQGRERDLARWSNSTLVHHLKCQLNF